MASLLTADGERACGLAGAPTEEDLLLAHWAAVDSLDADQVACQFSEQGSFFGLGPHAPVQGRRAIRRAFVQLFGELERLHHEPVTLWSHPGLVVAEADLTLVLDHDDEMTLPTTTILWTAGRAILGCRLLLYPEPALARLVRGFGVPHRVPVFPHLWGQTQATSCTP